MSPQNMRETLFHMPILRYHTRRDCIVVEKIDQSKNKEDTKRILKEYALDKTFIMKLNTEPGFFQYVLKEVGKLDLVRTHRRELAYLVMLDVLNPETTSVRESELEIDEDELTSRTRRSIRNEYYPELFFRPPIGLFTRKVDERIQPYKTIFTEDPEFDQNTLEKAAFLGSIHDAAVHPYLETIEKIMEVHASLRLVNPYEITDLRAFGDELNVAIDRVQKKIKTFDPERRSLVEDIRERTRIVEELKLTLDSAIHFYWFNRKTEKQKEEILKHRFELGYTREDAKKAVEENMAYFEDPPMVCDYISRGANSFMFLKRYDIAVWLYEECSIRKEIDDIDRGLALHNKAAVYLNWGKPKKYLQSLEEELDFWRNAKRQIDVGITYGYIAEAHYLLGSKSKGDSDFKEAFRVLEEIESSCFEYMKAWYYLADCAERVNRIDLEVKALRHSLEKSSDFDPEWALYLNQRLEDALQGYRTSVSMLRTGKPRRPYEYPYEKIGDSYHPISPSVQLKELYEKWKKENPNSI